MRTALQRFWEKVVVLQNGCWQWIGALDRDGYGRFRLEGESLSAHRAAWMFFIGILRPGVVLDHLCRFRACVNPQHLEPVTSGENTLRSPIAITAVNAEKTHCKYGHPFDSLNTYLVGNGHRMCRTCDRDRHRRRQ